MEFGLRQLHGIRQLGLPVVGHRWNPIASRKFHKVSIYISDIADKTDIFIDRISKICGSKSQSKIDNNNKKIIDIVSWLRRFLIEEERRRGRFEKFSSFNYS